MATYKNTKDKHARTSAYKFTITDLNDESLVALKEDVKRHNKETRKKVRKGEWKITSKHVNLWRVHLMPRGPRTEPSIKDYKHRYAYQSYLPMKYATHYDVYIHDCDTGNRMLREEVETGLTPGMQRRVRNAETALYKKEMELRDELKNAGIYTVYKTGGRKEYVTAEKKFARLVEQGYSPELIQRMLGNTDIAT